MLIILVIRILWNHFQKSYPNNFLNMIIKQIFELEISAELKVSEEETRQQHGKQR